MPRRTRSTIQPDGKIVIAGWVRRQVRRRSLPARRHARSRDFGTDGLVEDARSVTRGDEANAVALLPDGRIVADRHQQPANGPSSSGTWRTARSTATFGGDGIAGTPRSAHLWGAEDLAIQPNGRIVVVGAGQEGTKYELRRSAVPEPTVSEDLHLRRRDGMVLDPVRLWPGSRGGTADPTARSWRQGSTPRGLALVRYLPDGSLDRTFGDRGRVRVLGRPGTVGDLRPRRWRSSPNGRIVAAGNYDIFALGDRAAAARRPAGCVVRRRRRRAHPGASGSEQAPVRAGASSPVVEDPGRRRHSWPARVHPRTCDPAVRRGPLPAGRLARRRAGAANGKVATFFPGGARTAPALRCSPTGSSSWSGRSASSAAMGSRWAAT